MNSKIFLLILFFSCCSLFGAVEKSIIPLMNQLSITDLKGKVNSDQINDIETFSPFFEERLRVMSFNMLLNWSESHLDLIDRWENRKSRVIEYIQWAQPDLIGSQELQTSQIDEILCAFGTEYAVFREGPGKELPAIFYRKKRLELIHGQTLQFSKGRQNAFAFCRFRDKKTGQEFYALNTHLAFGNIENRYEETCKLRDFLLKNSSSLPFLITGDFNTFPFRQELDLPFFDGDSTIRLIEEGGVTDSMKIALFGHFGPISSTNFCSEKKKPFCSEGDPGVLLDHIFVNDKVRVLCHGIDPAKVDGHFPSDHFPVIIDVILCIPHQ